MKQIVTFQGQPVIELSDDANRVLISAEHGARILRWEHQGRQIVVWPDDAKWDRVIKVRGGNPILFPFAARHFLNGEKELWRDAEGVVRRMPMHGFCRDRAFRVVEDPEEDAVRMRVSEADDIREFYPFAFDFDVVVALKPGSRLDVRFETTNRSDRPLPYYAGHHFFFAVPHDKRGDWTLDLPCATFGWQDFSTGDIRHAPAAESHFTLADHALIDRFQIHPQRQATLANAVTGQKLIFDLQVPGTIPWYVVTTWTEFPESDFYCLEPWLGLPNAIHHGEGLRLVAPGTKEIATCSMDGSGW